MGGFTWRRRQLFVSDDIIAEMNITCNLKNDISGKVIIVKQNQ